MHTIRANGHTANTQCDPLRVTMGIIRYICGDSTRRAEDAVGLGRHTLQRIVRELGLMRSESACQITRAAHEGKATRPARRGILRRDYTPLAAHAAKDELVERWGVTRQTLNRDLRACGMQLRRRWAYQIGQWGSVKDWIEAQKRAVDLCRREDYTVAEAAAEMGITHRRVSNLLDAYDARHAVRDHLTK